MKYILTIALLLVTASLVAACDQDSAAPAPARGSSAVSEAGSHAEEEGDAHAEDGHEEEVARVELTPQQVADAGIEVVEAGPAHIRETLPLYGVITPNATAVRQVTARYPGAIRSIAKDFGDAVRQGETLATVESNESLQVYNVTAPLSGVVTARDANPGEQTGERVLFTVADLSTVWVDLSVFPRDAGKVRLDQAVRIRGADAGASAEGRVIWVAPFGSSANQTLTVRVLLDNAERRWAPGLYVTAEVTLAETDVPLAVRNDALQTMEEETVVFVAEEGGFEPRAVQLGRSDSETTEIVAGLAAGDLYVANNSFILKAELGKGEAEHGH